MLLSKSESIKQQEMEMLKSTEMYLITFQHGLLAAKSKRKRDEHATVGTF